MHYAAPYIGKPYLSGGMGPDAYDCWGLARAVLSHAGHDLPELSIGESTNAQTLRGIVDQHKWHPIKDSAKEFDAILCNSKFGKHIAVCIHANGELQYIHADDINGVEVVRELADLGRRGYSNFEVWRHGE